MLEEYVDAGLSKFEDLHPAGLGINGTGSLRYSSAVSPRN